jgi:hypothetical protein
MSASGYYAAADDAVDPDNPWASFGCDYCTETEEDGSALRIRGPWRFTVPGRDVDCCPACFQLRVPAAERNTFVRLPPQTECAELPVPPEALSRPTTPGKLYELAAHIAALPRPAAAVYALWVVPADGTLQRLADACILSLCARFKSQPFASHVPLGGGFTTVAAAEAGARAAAAAFRRPDGARLQLRLGAIVHGAAPLQCISAPAKPARVFGEAFTAAERVKREMKAGSVVSLHPGFHMTLLRLAEGTEPPAAAVRAAAAADAGADALAGLEFCAEAIAVWEVSAQRDYSRWSKVSEVPV